MDSNTHSTPASGPPDPSAGRAGLPELPELPECFDEWLEGPERPEGLAELPEDVAGLSAVVAELEAEDLDGLSDAALDGEVLALQRWMDCLHGQWLRRLATVDGRGAAGAEHGVRAASTASWLRNRLRMGSGAAREAVQTARALFRGPLPQTAQALMSGVISPAHARVLAQGTRQAPDPLTRAAEPVLLQAASRMDPPRLRQVVGHLLEVADPQGADHARQHRHERRGLWLSATLDDMVAVNGLLEPEAGQIIWAALEPLARPSEADDTRLGGQRTADALTELCRRSLEGGGLPKAGGVRPQLLVTVDLDSLLGRPDGIGGDLGWAGLLDPEGCRRLACDAAVTRVVVSRHPGRQDPDGSEVDPDDAERLQGRLRAAMALLPPTLGGAPSLPLDLGRATRVISPAQRAALAVRDRGCVFPDCDRPLAWCDAHHLWHWIDGGPTDLGNLALVCRAHHRTIHEGGWQLTRGPDGRFTATPGPPPHHRYRRRQPDPTAP